MSMYFNRHRRPRRRNSWQFCLLEVHFYALLVIVGVQGVRLLTRPTIIDIIVFVCGVVAVGPKLFTYL